MSDPGAALDPPHMTAPAAAGERYDTAAPTIRAFPRLTYRETGRGIGNADRC